MGNRVKVNLHIIHIVMETLLIVVIATGLNNSAMRIAYNVGLNLTAVDVMSSTNRCHH